MGAAASRKRAAALISCAGRSIEGGCSLHGYHVCWCAAPDGRGGGRPTDELMEMPVDGRVALAAAVVQALDIEHLDAAAAIADQARLLQLARDEGDAAALHTQHLRQELLRQRQGVAHQQIA